MTHSSSVAPGSGHLGYGLPTRARLMVILACICLSLLVSGLLLAKAHGAVVPGWWLIWAHS